MRLTTSIPSSLLSRLLCLALIVTPVAALLADSPQASSPSWNQWRGPSRDGTVGGASWPDDLAGLERRWQVELGKGYASPLIAGDRVFVAETLNGDTESVRALARNDGRELWRTSWPGQGEVPFYAAANGDWIRATPLYDDGALYVGGMEEVLVKLDADNGEVLWRVDFPGRFDTGVPDFGFISSPLADGDHLYVQAANSILKLDKATGDTVWRALENDGSIVRSGAFSSPVLTTLAGRRQLLVQTREALHGLDPKSGALLWTQPVPSFRGMNILTPTVAGDRILTSTYRGNTYLYRVARGPAGLEPSLGWRHKSQGYMSSPVVVDGHAYLHLGNGRLICLDLQTGTERWISQPMGKYWSLVNQGGKLLALNDVGELFLIAADPRRLRILDRRQVATSPTWAHLAVLGDELVVRDLQSVTSFRWLDAARQAAATTAP